MTESYAKVVRETSTILTQAIVETEANLMEMARELDALLHQLFREIGQLTFETILHVASQRATTDAQAEGLTVHRRKQVCFVGLFGPMQVESPYFYDPATRRSARPVAERLKITHQGRTRAVERALTDFGAEESFGHAAQRFEEHYGFAVGRTTVRQVTEEKATQAERFVQTRLATESAAFAQRRPGAERVLVELDGCEIRTGDLQPLAGEERTPLRHLPRHQRREQWREVRVGLARQLEETTPTYIAGIGKYPEVVSQLFGAAVSHGLSPRSETVGIADGGHGLMEELEAQFPRLTFILDRPHLQKHLYETAEAMALTAETREAWLSHQTECIDTGHVREVIAGLRDYQGTGRERVLRLSEYLSRFRDCVHYDAFKERGLPIGSGEVESAHRSIPQKRLKLPGACWKPETINPMLALRVLRANGWWGEFWDAKNAA